MKGCMCLCWNELNWQLKLYRLIVLSVSWVIVFVMLILFDGLSWLLCLMSCRVMLSIIGWQFFIVVWLKWGSRMLCVFFQFGLKVCVVKRLLFVKLCMFCSGVQMCLLKCDLLQSLLISLKFEMMMSLWLLICSEKMLLYCLVSFIMFCIWVEGLRLSMLLRSSFFGG